MVMTSKRKDHPLSMRLPDADLALIDRAASLRGRSRTDFMREAAVLAAEETVMEHSMIRMTPEGFGEFMAVMTAPASSVPAIVEVLCRTAPWES